MDLKQVIIGYVITPIAVKYGYTYQDTEQVLKDNMLILPANILVGNAIFLNKQSYAIHLINGSWRGKKGIDKFIHLVRNNYPRLFPIVNFIDKSFKKTYRTSKQLLKVVLGG